MLNFVRIKIWDNLPQNSKIFFFSLNFPLIYFAKKCDILGSVSFTNIDAVSQGKPVIYGIATVCINIMASVIMTTFYGKWSCKKLLLIPGVPRNIW